MQDKLLKGIDDRGAQVLKTISYSPNQASRDLLDETRMLYQVANEIQNDQKYTARLHYSYALLSWHEPLQRGRKDRERQLQAIRGELQLAIDADPTFAPAQHDMAVLAFNESGDYAGAARGLKAAIDAAPDWALPHFTFGRIYIEQGRAEEATLEFQKAIRLDGNLSQARAGLGVAFALSGDLAAGLKLAQSAEAQNSSNAYVL